MSKSRKEIDYWGAGFLVKLRNFPVYVDEGEHLPDVPLGRLHRAIAYEVIKKPHLLTGNELAFLRSQSDLTRSEMARRVGVTRRTLINWEETLDGPIKTPPIAQLGIRCVCASWIFPADNSFLKEIVDLTRSSAPSFISLSYSKILAEDETRNLRDAVDSYRAGRIVPEAGVPAGKIGRLDKNFFLDQ